MCPVAPITTTRATPAGYSADFLSDRDRSNPARRRSDEFERQADEDAAAAVARGEPVEDEILDEVHVVLVEEQLVYGSVGLLIHRDALGTGCVRPEQRHAPVAEPFPGGQSEARLRVEVCVAG